MPSDPPLLKVHDVSKSYGDPDSPSAVRVLNGINLELARGESLAITGPSGSGKSTLLNLIGTLDHPDSGTITLDGVNLNDLTEDELARVRNLQIGTIFQAHHLLPQCTVLENVLIPTLATGSRSARQSARERAESLLDSVGLSHRTHHRPGQLSGGECQRVAVARALINEPTLLLADEPTGSLDRSTALEVADLLVKFNSEQKVALVAVTHSQEFASRLGRVLELRDGLLAPPGGSA